MQAKGRCTVGTCTRRPLDKKFYLTGIQLLQRVCAAVQNTGGVAKDFVEEMVALAMSFLDDAQKYEEGLVSQDAAHVRQSLAEIWQWIVDIVEATGHLEVNMRSL